MKNFTGDIEGAGMNMPNILEFIAENPSLGAGSADDAKCITLLTTLGMLETIQACSRSDIANFTVIVSDAHATHWIVAMCWKGYPVGGNGYRVFCLPKSHTSEQKLREFVNNIQEGQRGHDPENSVPWQPSRSQVGGN